jgi:predicted amidophosphoribosyltransferase
MNQNGYLCEHCGKEEAKYEARFVMEGKNILLCERCLKHFDSSHCPPVFHTEAGWEWKTQKRA